MSNTMTHRHATMIPKSDKIDEIRELLVQCEQQISLKKAEGGPISWSASYDEESNRFYVDSIFADEEQLAFHQQNIGPILKGMFPLLEAPPEATIYAVFAVTQ